MAVADAAAVVADATAGERLLPRILPTKDVIPEAAAGSL